jgi:hypothetical protein
MAAAAMPHSEDADLLGFDSGNESGKALLWFDSEQSPDDFWYCVARALKRAGLDKPPAWLHAYCLTGLGYQKGWQAVLEALRVGADQHGGIHSVLLDGSADFVRDVNDPAESNAFVATVHDLAIQHVCPITNVLHFNPGTDKSRGHLGSQLERKAETNLTLEKDTHETTVIFSTKNRRAGIPKNTGPRFRFDTAAGMHVSVESGASAKTQAARAKLADLAESVFGSHPSMQRNDLEKTVRKRLNVSESTAYRKVADMVDAGVIKKSVAGLYAIACPAESKCT